MKNALLYNRSLFDGRWLRVMYFVVFAFGVGMPGPDSEIYKFGVMNVVSVPMGWVGGWFICKVIELNMKLGLGGASPLFYRLFLVSAIGGFVLLLGVFFKSVFTGLSFIGFFGALASLLMFLSLNFYHPVLDDGVSMGRKKSERGLR